MCEIWACLKFKLVWNLNLSEIQNSLELQTFACWFSDRLGVWNQNIRVTISDFSQECLKSDQKVQISNTFWKSVWKPNFLFGFQTLIFFLRRHNRKATFQYSDSPPPSWAWLSQPWHHPVRRVGLASTIQYLRNAAFFNTMNGHLSLVSQMAIYHHLQGCFQLQDYSFCHIITSW